MGIIADMSASSYATRDAGSLSCARTPLATGPMHMLDIDHIKTTLVKGTCNQTLQE